MTDYSPLHTDISNEARIDIIAAVEIESIVTAPAHRQLRNPDGVFELSRNLAAGASLALADDPIILNVVTESVESEVVMRAIECLDGNHRLAAFCLAGLGRKIGDLPRPLLRVRVNGWSAGGEGSEPRWIPLGAAERSSLPKDSWFVVPEDWGPKGLTAQIAGDICSLDECFTPKDRGVTIGELIARLRG